MNGAGWPGVSVIMPVRNEERHLAAAVAGVLAQDYPGEIEVIMAVGPSADATSKIAAELVERDPRVRVVDNPDGRTPTALNLAVAAARFDIVVRVDGHGELGEGYIARAVELLDETGADNVGGVMDAQGTTPFEQAVAHVYTSRLGLGGAAFHLGNVPAGPVETVFLGVFRKEALLAVGGFDESMRRAQDWELNYRLRRSGRDRVVLAGAAGHLSTPIPGARSGQADVRDRPLAARGGSPTPRNGQRALSRSTGRGGRDRCRLAAGPARPRPRRSVAAGRTPGPSRLRGRSRARSGDGSELVAARPLASGCRSSWPSPTFVGGPAFSSACASPDLTLCLNKSRLSECRWSKSTSERGRRLRSTVTVPIPCNT